MLHLRVGEDLVHGIDRAAGHAGLVQPGDPVLRGVSPAAASAAGHWSSPGSRRGTCRWRRPGPWPARSIPSVSTMRFHISCPPPARLIMPVLGTEQAGRHGGRVVVAGLLRDFMLHGPAGRLEVHHRHHGLQQAGMDPAALARALPLQQRHQDAERGVEPGGQVGDRDADPHRALAGQAGHAHQPAHALGDLVEARPLRIGAGLAEAADRAEHDARVHRRQRGVVDAQPVLHVGAVILHHHIGLGDHAAGTAPCPSGCFRLMRDAALVAMDMLEVRPVPLAAHALAGVDLLRRLDLDDVGAPIGQLADAGGAGAHAGEVEHGEAGQRQHGFAFGIGWRLLQGRLAVAANRREARPWTNCSTRRATGSASSP